MHWRQLIRGCELYHADGLDESRYQPFANWPPPTGCTLEMAEQLIRFINSWGTRSPMSPRALHEALTTTYPKLCALSQLRIEELDPHKPLLDGYEAVEVISVVFESVASCDATRREATGASKILHVLLPHLFVMWDARIAAGYGLSRDRTGEVYACKFLPRVAAEMEESISTYQQDNDTSRANAVAGLVAKGCGRSLPKLLDEYNFAKFTMSVDELWVKAS